MSATTPQVGEAPADLAPAPTHTDGEIDMAVMRRYRELRAAASGATAEADALKKEADDLERVVVEMLGEAGVQNMNVDGQTIYLQRATYAQKAEGVTTDILKEALRAAGEDNLVTETINGSTLNAFVRELLDGDDPKGLPEPLRGLLDLGERYSARIKASTSRAKRPKPPTQRSS